MNIVHSVPYLIPEAGGPSRSVPELCAALAQVEGLSIQLLSLDLGQRFSAPNLPDPALVETMLVPNTLSVGLRQLWAPQYKPQLTKLIRAKSIDLIHDHCLWLPNHIINARVAQKRGLTFVVSTRGMLEPWALQRGRIRKRVMWWVYQRQQLQKAQLLHATSLHEAENLRKLGLKTAIAVVPNGVTVPAQRNLKNEQRSMKTALFLSRIHPKKGLLNLISALQQVDLSGWRVVIAGPDEGGHQAEVEQAVQQAGLTPKISFAGPISDQDKWDVYQQADLFVLPTFSENFGIVVAEALACAVPVITTKGAPWHELETSGCGWWVEIGVEPLVEALHEALSLSDVERQTMGQNGRHLVAEKYNWATVADQMAAAYRWVLGQGERPDFILSDKKHRIYN